MDDYVELCVKLIDAMNEALENKKLTFVPCSKEFISAVVDAIEQLVRERDAVLKDFLEVAQMNDSECDYCKKQYKCLGIDRGRITNKGKMECGIWRDNFEWRGVQE